MCRDVWVWASSDFPSMHLRWWQACCKKNFKGGVKKIWHLRGPALMVLSLLCQTEDKIFISHYFVSTLEKRFCRFFCFFFLQYRGTKFPVEFCMTFFSSFVCVQPYMNVCVHHAEQPIKRCERENQRNRKKNKKKMRWRWSKILAAVV